jgi:amidophosphoribosyltransferase
MIAHGRTTPQIAAELGCDSLHYLSLEGVYEAIGADASTHCDACFSGRYPLARTHEAGGKYALEEPHVGEPGIDESDAAPLVRA